MKDADQIWNKKRESQGTLFPLKAAMGPCQVRLHIIFFIFADNVLPPSTSFTSFLSSWSAVIAVMLFKSFWWGESKLTKFTGIIQYISLLYQKISDFDECSVVGYLGFSSISTEDKRRSEE